MTITLTDRAVRAAKPRSAEKQRDFRDRKVLGLTLRAYTSGRKTWFLFYRRRADDQRRSVKLGPYPGVSLAQARQLATVNLGRIAAGEDPQAHREAARARCLQHEIDHLDGVIITDHQ